MSDENSILPSTNESAVGTGGITLYGFTVPRLKVANAVAFAATLIFNYISSSRIISPYGIGTISRKYPTIITPASGAFAIWLFIYCLQFGFIIYQFYWPKETEAVLSRDIGFWYVSSCIFNSLWIIVFTQGTSTAMYFSVLTIFLLLFSICMIYVRTKCWWKERTSVIETIILDVHFSMYGGWVTVASIVNTSIAITTIWDATPEAAVTCSIIMLVVALLLNVVIVLYRRDPVWGGVLCWATYFISVKSENSVHTTALFVCVFIGCLSVAVAVWNAVSLSRRRKSTQDQNIYNNSVHLLKETPPSVLEKN